MNGLHTTPFFYVICCIVTTTDTRKIYQTDPTEKDPVRVNFTASCLSRVLITLTTRFTSTEPTNTRVWHDRSGQFKVDAEFLGVHNGKLRLHKVNGVVIEVPAEKMSFEDMDFIRRLEARKSGSASSRPAPARTSPSRDSDNVPLGDLRRPNSATPATRSTPTAKKPRIDWFDFFLSSECDIDDCTRYAAAFERDKIDESILADLEPPTLRTLGLREGDIIRVMKKIQQREWKAQPPRAADAKVQDQLKKDEELAARLQAEYDGRGPKRSSTTSPAPNLFSGPNGSLKNNTRRGRPTPTKSATLGLDTSSIASASEQLSRTSSPVVSTTANGKSSSAARSNTSSAPAVGGFDDDAWAPRPASTAPKAPTPAPAAPPAPTPPPAVSAISPPPAPPVSAPPPAPPAQPAASLADAHAIQRPATSNAGLSLATEFDVLAKLGTMRPPSAPMPQNTPPAVVPTPPSYHQGLGVGGSTLPMASYLQTQQTGVPSPLQPIGGPRAPFAPVPSNESLLKPLIPTTTGFNSFVPTRPGAAPSPLNPNAGFQMGNPSFLTSQPTGLGPFGGGSFGPSPAQPLQPNPTGYGSSFSQPSSTLSQFSTTSTYGSSPGYQSPMQPQPTGFGTFGGHISPQPQFNAGTSFINSLQSRKIASGEIRVQLKQLPFPQNLLARSRTIQRPLRRTTTRQQISLRL